MHMLFRNFFYAVGFTALFSLYRADPSTFTFGDFVRLAQSTITQQQVLVVTALLVGLEMLLGNKRRRAAVSASVATRSSLTAPVRAKT